MAEIHNSAVTASAPTNLPIVNQLRPAEQLDATAHSTATQQQMQLKHIDSTPGHYN